MSDIDGMIGTVLAAKLRAGVCAKRAVSGRRAVTPEAARTREEKARKRHDRMFADAPEDVLHDPAIGAAVSRFGQDRGARLRPTVPVFHDVGAGGTARRVRDTLDRLRGVISDIEYDAGRQFQQSYELAGYDRCKTTNLSGVRSGGRTIEDHMADMARARAKVHSVREMLGGPDSPVWTAVALAIGSGKPISGLSQDFGEQKLVVTGFVRAGLAIMGRDYARRCKIKAGKGFEE